MKEIGFFVKLGLLKSYSEVWIWNWLDWPNPCWCGVDLKECFFFFTYLFSVVFADKAGVSQWDFAM